jgi:putative ATP-dependent endonuclease of OLD family
MIIKSIYVKNLRCIEDETLALDSLTVLVGANGVGKSSFLKALELFYSPEQTLEEEDFFADNTKEDVVIFVTFKNLSDEAKGLFSKYLENDELTVARVFKWHDDGKVTVSYHGSKLQVSEFGPIRSAAAAAAKDLYNSVKAQEKFKDLPVYGRSKDASLQALEEWENNHPELCKRMRDDGQFFGYKEVSAGYLGRFTRFVLVPAVRDASSDGEEGRGSLFTQLIDIAVRSNTAGNIELLALGDEMKKRYEDIINTKKTSELKKLQADLTRELGYYVVSTDVELSWDSMPQVQLPPPRAVAKIGEEGHRTAIERKGHGLQRAFIMTLLQYLESVRQKPAVQEEGGEIKNLSIPNLVIGIEEPELYQHPDRQRHFARLLMRLAVISTEKNTPSTQVVYTTHSPHFVGLDRFENIRLAKKDPVSGIPKTKLTSVTLNKIAQELSQIVGGDPGRFTAEALRARLQTLMTPWMNEGFFACTVVLVEGEQDRAAVLATANLLGKDLESMGVAVIPCMGKTNIDRPALIFRGFGIPLYLIWDSDEGSSDPKTATNRILLKIAGAQEEDYPNTVATNYACFSKELGKTLHDELTPTILDPLINTLQTEFEMTKGDILKNPAIMTELLIRANQQGSRSGSLVSIVENILRHTPVPVALKVEK